MRILHYIQFRAVKVKSRLTASKFIAFAFFDRCYLLFIYFFHERWTISVEYDCKVRLVNRRKRGDLYLGEVTLFQGNARPNKAALTQEKLPQPQPPP